MIRAVGLAVTLLVVGACGAPRSDEILVGSASSFSHVLDATEGALDTYNLKVVVGGSQLLVTQVLEDAPIDLIITADWPTMESLVAAKKTASAPSLLSRNSLVIAVEAGNPLGIDSIQDLARPDLKVVLADSAVPLGAYSSEVLRQAGVEAKPVSLAGNATAVAGLLASGEADAGLVYQTDAALWGLTALSLPGDFAVTTEYFAAPIAGSSNVEGATSLIDFLTGTEGQELLATLGFRP